MATTKRTTRADLIAAQILRHVARSYPEADPTTVQRALELAAAQIRAAIREKAGERDSD